MKRAQILKYTIQAHLIVVEDGQVQGEVVTEPVFVPAADYAAFPKGALADTIKGFEAELNATPAPVKKPAARKRR